jgi:hypothetical protein
MSYFGEMNFFFSNSSSLAGGSKKCTICFSSFVASRKNGLLTENDAFVGGIHISNETASAGEFKARAIIKTTSGFASCDIWIAGSICPQPRKSHSYGNRYVHRCIKSLVTNVPSVFSNILESGNSGIHSGDGIHLQRLSNPIVIATDSASTDESFLTCKCNSMVVFDDSLCKNKCGSNPSGSTLVPFVALSPYFVTFRKSFVRSIQLSGADSAQSENLKTGYGFLSGAEFMHRTTATGTRETNQMASAFDRLFRNEQATPCPIARLTAKKHNFVIP